MALAITHIKFAVDLKDYYKVADFSQYISGTSYPDSRYITKVERKVTHNIEDLESINLKNDDFRKGWHVHLLCDIVQSKAINELLPSEFNDEINEYGQDHKLWIKKTAVKNIQEINIFNDPKFNAQEYLDLLCYSHNPNGEDIVKIKESNLLIVNIFANKTKISIDEYNRFWKALGLNENLLLKINTKTNELMQNKIITDIINNDLYKKMIDYAKQYLESKKDIL